MHRGKLPWPAANVSNVAEMIQLFTLRDYLLGLPYHPFWVKLLLAKKQFVSELNML